MLFFQLATFCGLVPHSELAAAHSFGRLASLVVIHGPGEMAAGAFAAELAKTPLHRAVLPLELVFTILQTVRERSASRVCALPLLIIVVRPRREADVIFTAVILVVPACAHVVVFVADVFRAL